MKLDVLCVRQDARSQISTTLLAAREKGRFAQSRFPDPLNGVKLAKGGFSAKGDTALRLTLYFPAIVRCIRHPLLCPGPW